MSLRTGLMDSSSTFAFLLGRSSGVQAKGKAEELDKPDKDEHREDAKAEDEKEDKSKAKSKAKAEDDDKDEDETKEEREEREKKEEDDADDKKDARKGKAKADEDDGDTKAAAIRVRERARCEAIFLSAGGKVRPDLAAHFAFRTSMSRVDAVAALAVAASGQAPGKGGLRERMDRTPNPDVGSGGEAPSGMQPHQRLAAAHAKATGRK